MSITVSNWRPGLKVHDAIAKEHEIFWRELQGSANISCVSSLGDALAKSKQQGRNGGMRTLITGSTHLVGQALDMLQRGTQEGEGVALSR